MASPKTLQDRTLDQACKMVLFVALELRDKKWEQAEVRGRNRYKRRGAAPVR